MAGNTARKINPKNEHLKRPVEHIDIKSFNAIPIVNQYDSMSFQARNLARAAQIFDMMISNTKCAVILTLAGSIISAGCKKVIFDLIENNMIDAVVSTGATIVDMDFFEGLGFRHYQGTPFVNDDDLMKAHIDRIYDTYISEDDLRVCDMTIGKIADGLEPRPYSSREFIREMGRYLVKNKLGRDSIVRLCYEKRVPIFVPAFSDCSAGFGLVHHQHHRQNKPMLTIDSVKDFYDLTKIKIAAKDTGLFMIGGGVPKNFAQDITVAGEILGKDVGLHRYAVQITVADERDGACSSSTLKEAHSWGKVDDEHEQMVFCEATLAFPLIASYVYHKKNWRKRKENRYSELLDQGKI